MKRKLFVSLGVLGLLVAVVLPFVRLDAQDFIQGYRTEEKLLEGSIVVLGDDDVQSIRAANQDNNEGLLGIVIDTNESALTLSATEANTFVATSGKYQVLISDINGKIEEGDWITTSPIDAVGMTADGRQSRIIGKSLQKFDTATSANILSTVQLTDAGGTERTVAIGKILIDISVGENPLSKNAIERAPDFLVSIGESLAGKSISIIRVYAALAIILITFAVGGATLYSTVRTSFIAIGRNPLAKRSVFSGLRQVLLIIFLIFLIGLSAVYLLLRL